MINLSLIDLMSAKKLPGGSDYRSHVRLGTKWAVIGRVLGYTISFFTSVILVRYLSVPEYGNYRLLLTLGTLMIYVVSCGIQNSVGRFLPEFYERKQYHEIQGMILTFTLLRLAVSAAVLLILFFWKGYLVSFFNLPEEFASWFWLIAIYLLLHLTIPVFGEYFHSSSLDIRARTTNDLLKALFFLTCLCTLPLTFPRLVAIIVGMEVVSLLFFGSSFFRYLVYFRRFETRDKQAAKTEWKRIGKYSLFTAFYNLSGLVIGLGFDNLIIVKYRGSEEVALYAFGLMLISVFYMVSPTAMFKGIIQNIVVQRYTKKADNEAFRFAIGFVLKMGFFFCLPCFLIVCTLAKPIIIYIYREEYLPCIPILYMFAGMYLVRVFSFGYTVIITTLEMVKYLSISYVVAAYNLLASLILVQYLGFVGVAVATATAESLLCLYFFFVVWKKVDVDPIGAAFSLWPILISSGGAAVFAIVLRPMISGCISLALVFAGCLAVYIGICYLIKPFSDEERTLINGFIGRRVWVF